MLDSLNSERKSLDWGEGGRKEVGVGDMRAHACSKGEFQVVRAKRVVVDCDIDDIV